MGKSLLLYLWALAICGLIVLVVLPMAIGFPFSYNKKSSQVVAKDGECMIWCGGKSAYLGMGKLCSAESDCASYYQSFADYLAYDLGESFDKSKIICRDISYGILRAKNGQALNCSSGHDCFSEFFARVRMPKGSMPQEIVKNANEIFRCDGGICQAPAGVVSFWDSLE
jgi:hypothetical protein